MAKKHTSYEEKNTIQKGKQEHINWYQIQTEFLKIKKYCHCNKKISTDE